MYVFDHRSRSEAIGLRSTHKLKRVVVAQQTMVAVGQSSPETRVPRKPELPGKKNNNAKSSDLRALEPFATSDVSQFRFS
jgi:hypothetical protein